MFLPDVVWWMREPFLTLNRIQWFLSFPARRFIRNVDAPWVPYLFWLSFPILLVYRVIAYILLIPFRFINAVYFDVLLFLSVSFRDEVMYLFHGNGTILHRILLFPYHFVVRNGYRILQSVFMVVFDIAWPTLTMFHGTGEQEASEIASTGKWRAGTGDWFGTGIYFGISTHTARHYARSENGTPYILARVTLFPCRPVATLPQRLRSKIGRGKGDEISRGVGFPWASLEHWRDDHQWYEYCVIYKEKFREQVPWRIRPICIIRDGKPAILPGGVTVWPKLNDYKGIGVLGVTILLLILVYIYFPHHFHSTFSVLLQEHKGPLKVENVHIQTSAPAPTSPSPSIGTSIMLPHRTTAAKKAWVAAAELNVRSGPSAEYSIIGKLRRGQEVHESGKSDNGKWSFINYPFKGWVRNKYLRRHQLAVSAHGAYMWITAHPRLRVRSGPGTSYKITGHLAYGERVKVDHYNADKSWAYITEPYQGWVSAAYLSSTSPNLCIQGQLDRFEKQPNPLNEIWGRVLDLSGRPIAGWKLEVYVPHYEDRFRVPTMSQKDGSFYWAGLTPQNEYGVRVVDVPYKLLEPVTFRYTGWHQRAIITFRVKVCP